MTTSDQGVSREPVYEIFTRGITSLLFVVMLVVTCSGIFARYVLNNSLVWADTVALWLFVWLTFFGAAIAVRRGAHMAMDVVREVLPAQLRLADRVMVELAVLAASIFLMLSGLQLVQTSGGAVSPATGVSSGWAMAAIPVGGGLMAVEALRRLTREIRSSRPASGGSGSGRDGRDGPTVVSPHDRGPRSEL